jgi:hypothetical protein
MGSFGTVIHLTREDLGEIYKDIALDKIMLSMFKEYTEVKFPPIKTKNGEVNGLLTFGVDLEDIHNAHTIIFHEDEGKGYRILKDRYITKY